VRFGFFSDQKHIFFGKQFSILKISRVGFVSITYSNFA
jgi:hypothetical protein